MKSLHDTPEPSAHALVRFSLWAVAAAVILSLSVLGLFELPVGVYDESFLLLDARLVRGGSLPYLDFYTHYGPLGYTLIAAAFRIIPNPGIALRTLQAVSMAGAAVLLFLMAWGKPRRRAAVLAPGAAAICVFALANVFRFAAFLGFVLCFAALAAAAVSQRAASAAAVRVSAGAAGFALALAGLVRPVFVAYAGVAIAAIGLAEIAASGRKPGARLRLFAVIAVALVSLVVIWIALYRRIPPAVALQATILGPSRLVSGGERFLNPRFLLSPTGSGLAALGGALAGGLVAGACASWIWSARSSSTRAFAVLAALAGALGTIRLERSPNPAPEATLLAGLLLAIGLIAVFRMRREIADSTSIAAGALFGVTAMAFGHYFWTRTDRAHLAPSVGLAAIAAAVAWPHFRTAGRLFALATLLTIAFLFPQLPLQAGSLAAGGAPVPAAPWPAATVPRDAADAVRFADEHSDPASRFVAVASTHAVTSANPVLLFLLSSRRPYTRWYQYDPGVQDSRSVQEEMAAELTRSGSRAAIVWDTRVYVFEPRVADLKRTPFDETFDRLYPIRAARFGEYEVRFRAERPGP